jgi:hypothetical protein
VRVEQPFSDITTSGLGTNVQDVPDFATHLRYESDFGHVQLSSIFRAIGFQPTEGDVTRRRAAAPKTRPVSCQRLMIGLLKGVGDAPGIARFQGSRTRIRRSDVALSVIDTAHSGRGNAAGASRGPGRGELLRAGRGRFTRKTTGRALPYGQRRAYH